MFQENSSATLGFRNRNSVAGNVSKVKMRDLIHGKLSVLYIASDSGICSSAANPAAPICLIPSTANQSILVHEYHNGRSCYSMIIVYEHS